MLFGGCANPIPLGYIDKMEYFDENSFQDYTDYCVYLYDSADSFIANQNYHKITADEIDNIKSYFENFQSWMEASDRIAQYDFDENCINESDYVRIETKEGESIGTGKYGKFDNYTIYFFDCESLTLYYIHSNL